MAISVFKRKIHTYRIAGFNCDVYACLCSAENNLEEYNQQTLKAASNQMNEQSKFDFLNSRKRFYDDMKKKINKLKRQNQHYLHDPFADPKLQTEHVKSKFLVWI